MNTLENLIEEWRRWKGKGVYEFGCRHGDYKVRESWPEFPPNLTCGRVFQFKTERGLRKFLETQYAIARVLE